MAMILTCPRCQTRFSLGESALGTDGRKVKCGRCAEVWFQKPPVERPLAPPSPPSGASGQDRGEAAGGTGFATAPDDADLDIHNRAASASAGRSRRAAGAAAAGWVLLLLLVTGLGAALYAGRDAVVDAWPPAWRLYATLGLDIPSLPEGRAVAPYAGLSFVDVVPRWAEMEGEPVLMVSGGLVNGGAGLARIPLFEARLLNAEGETLDVRPVDPGFARLDPGETRLFEMALADPQPGTHRVDLVFATGTAMSGSGP